MKHAEPMIRSIHIVASRDAVRDVFGEEALADTAQRMPERERAEVFADHHPYWCSERAMIALTFGIWEGPADRRRARLEVWLWRTVDNTFGRIRRAFLAMATPEKLIEHAPRFWKSDRTSGVLEGRVLGAGRGVFTLRDHPYTETPQARATVAEMLRYLVELTRTPNVTETHALVEPGVLEVRIKWGEASSPTSTRR